jgi:hypothetical protein
MSPAADRDAVNGVNHDLVHGITFLQPFISVSGSVTLHQFAPEHAPVLRHQGRAQRMTSVYLDSRHSDDERRRRLYAGDLYLYSPSRSTLELVALAEDLIARAFGSKDPELAQHDMRPDEYAALLSELKPKFIHHPDCKRLLPEILASLGCDHQQTFFDVPRMRTSTSHNFLTTGIAYAFHPHRDTWYSAPMCQVNWWMPIRGLTADNGMAFHPDFFSKGLRNSSAIYNYQRWNQESRFNASQHIKVDSRPQPKALGPVPMQPDIRLTPPPGGVIVFSGAQLHSSVENRSGRTRFSIDFRTVHLGDALGLKGATNVDSNCTGSTMTDYLRCSDLAHLPNAACELYESGPPQAALMTA